MSRPLPTLNSLKAFDAAGRHLSFTKAATDLAVTQAAVSQQIKALENQLGVILFVRDSKPLKLTQAGNALLPVVAKSFDQIASAVEKLAATADARPLRIRLAPSFAAHWLLPRLEDFRRRHGAIELQLFHSNAPANFATEQLDLAVTYGSGCWPGVVAHRVLSLDFFPVCCPALLQGEAALNSPADLGRATLLHDADYQTWSEWFALAGLDDVDPRRGPVFDNTNVLIQAAVDGLGVALASSVFVDELLTSGRLVKPFGPVLRTAGAYFAVCPQRHLERPAVRAFMDWLLAVADPAG